MPTVIEELQDTVSRIAADVGPAIVRIGHRRGTGVVVGPGLVLTNAHNLHDEELTVGFADGRTAEGTLKGIDPSGDLAVLDVDTGDAPAIRWRDGDAVPAVGTPVFALANPAGRGLRVTFGLVSAVSQAFRGPRGSRIGGGIEHTAPLARGSSGGPIVDASGTVIGINTHRVGDGFYLAMPADVDLRTRVEALSRGESPVRPRLGVALAPAHVARRLRAAVGLPEQDGLLVRGVEDGSPAEAAGIRQGDLLVRAADRPLLTHDDLFAALGAATGTIEIGLIRGTDTQAVTVTL